MKSLKSTSLYSRLALITSVTLVVGYFVVYAVYQNIDTSEVASNATITSTLMGKIKNNLDTLNTQVTDLTATVVASSIWSKVGSDINYTTGKVGIGTVTPAASLDVKRTATDSQFAGWIEGSDVNNYGLGVNITNTTSAKAIADFKSGNTSRLFVRADGNVGIGTSSPGARLHVYGNSGEQRIMGISDLALDTTDPWQGSFQIKAAPLGNNWLMNTVAYAASSKGVRFYNTGGDQAYTAFEVTQAGGSRFIVDGLGNVGIGMVPTNGNGALQVKDGIAFPATQVPVANPNTLDDYEEGTWTPTLGGYTTLGTFTPGASTGGTYIKIGRKVTVWFYVNGTVTGASADYLTVNGLPFTDSNDVGRSESGGSISYLTGLDMGATGRGWFMYPARNSTRAIIGAFTQGGTTTVNPNATIALYGTITYYTAN